MSNPQGNNKPYKIGSHLIIGGARSGKSAYAEQLITASADQLGKRKIYIATAEAFNQEMQERIDLHITQRGDSWQTIQEPVDIIKALLSCQDTDVILVDCLTIWLNNLLHYEHDADAEIARLCHTIPKLSCEVIFVSNEIGLGLVPMDKLSRQFRDLSGKMNQSVAKIADKVTFVAAGLPLIMKDNEAQ